MSLTEFDIIDRYFRPLQCERPELRFGIGDDAAVLAPPAGQELVLTLDTLVAGVHFPQDAPAHAVGYKALAVNLSDLAAMGAAPSVVLLSLTVPEFDADWLAEFSAGFGELAAEHGVSLVGGDVTCGPLSVSVQATGLVDAGCAIRRSGASPGDVILVSGTLGDAALGLEAWSAGEPDNHDTAVRRLHYPTPRVALGRLLVGRAHACVDVSDGLLADLGHVLAASGRGAEVHVDRVPVSADFEAHCAPDRRLEYALAWGDDYELCACVPAADAEALVADAEAIGERLTSVGRVTAEPSVAVFDADGRRLRMPRAGYRHFGTDGEYRARE